MSLFGDIGNFFGNLFGGGNQDDKKKKQQQQQYVAPQKAVSFGNANPSQSQNQNQSPQQTPRPVNGLNLVLPGATQNTATGFPDLLKKAQPQQPSDTRSDGQKEIDQLTANNLKKAMDEEKNRTSWFDRTFTDRDWAKRAEVTARNRALTQYQDIHGYNKQPEVMQALQKNRTTSDALVKESQDFGNTLNKVQDVATKAAQVAQWVPVTGSVLNLGLAGSSGLAKATGNTAYANELDKQRNLNEFGMTPEQYNALDEETKHKLGIIRNVGYGLAPLDFLGLTGLAKSEGVNTAKDAALQLVKNGAVDEATKQSLKTLGVDTAKNLAKSTAIGTGVSAAGQQYLTGHVDPLEALKTGTMIAGTNELFNPTQLRKAPTSVINEADSGLVSRNPNYVEDAAAHHVTQTAAEDAQAAAQDLNTPAYQRGFGTEPTKPPTPQELYKASASAARKEGSIPGQTFDAGLDPSNPIDAVPAFQRNGQVVAPGNQARADELTRILGAIPETSDQTAAFNLRTRYGELIRQRPELAPQLRARLQTLLTQPNPREAVQKELESLQLGTAPEPSTARAVESAPTPTAPAAATPEPTVAQLAGNQRPEAALQTAIEQAHNAGDNQKVAELITQLPPDMQDPMRSALGIETPAAPPAPTPAPASPLPAVPTGGAQGGPQVPVAPRTREAAMKQLGDLAKQIPGDGKLRDVTNLDQLATDAQGVIANLSPEELVGTFGSRNVESLPNDAKSFAVLRAARDKLSELAKADPQNGDIKDAIANTIDEMANRASGNGLLQRVVQEEFDAMPLEAKVRYLARKIDQANKDTKGYETLASDPAKLQEVQAALTSRLTASQDLAEQIAGLENHLNQAADAARNGQKVDIKDVVQQLKQKRIDLQVKNGEVVKYFQSLIPGRTKAQRALVDFPKRMMLASFSGRINDVLTTAANVAHEQTTNLTQGILAKGYNLIKGRGSVSDTTKGGSKLFGSLKTGLQKFKGEAGGKVYVNDIQKNLKGVEDLRSGLRKPGGPVGRTVQAATEFATNLTEGVRDQRLYQLADQEAAKLGLTGSFRKQYAEVRAAVPSRQMLDAAETLHKQVNNLNDNPISRTLNKVSQAMEGDSKFGKTGIGGVIKNQILPFTSWLGGNIWNSVTDKNVVAQFTKFLYNAHKGDPEAAIKNLAGTINGAIEGYAIGYQLAAHGMLTDKNAEGYNDGGAYFHIGDRYIPVGQLGFFAPNIVLGKAAFDGVHSDNPVAAVAGDIGNYAWHGLALGQALGVENNVVRAYNTATEPGHNAMDAAAVAGAGVAGQFIPGLTGDVNTFLNNGVPGIQGSDALNPTHEAANTRVGAEGLTPTGRPTKAKDVPASALASLQNRIPILSQQLPRKAGVAAPDFIDRTDRGDRATQAQKDAAVKAKTDAEVAADFATRGVPDPNAQYQKGDSFDNAVENRIENGKFDLAIEGLQAQLKKVKAGSNVTEKQTKPIEEQIKQIQVLKDGKFDPAIRDTYKSVSVSEWRNMGDPESDTYDPATYEMLYKYDSALAKAGISGSSLAHDKNKYTVKTKKSGSGGSRSAATSNTIGSTPDLGKFSFGNLAPQKAGSIPIPQLKQISSSDLVKKRKITVSRA